jgi:uncharacterized protein (DUF885 family)
MQENCLCASAARFQLSQRILQRVAEISEEMDLALQALGYTQGSIKQRLQALADAPGSAYEASEGVREEIQAEMFRAVRLVVDTGIHARRWSRQEAFNLPDFHAAVLGNGALPLAILRREVERALPATGS